MTNREDLQSRPGQRNPIHREEVPGGELDSYGEQQEGDSDARQHLARHGIPDHRIGGDGADGDPGQGVVGQHRLAQQKHNPLLSSTASEQTARRSGMPYLSASVLLAYDYHRHRSVLDYVV
jgi:hypothetical protein